MLKMLAVLMCCCYKLNKLKQLTSNFLLTVALITHIAAKYYIKLLILFINTVIVIKVDITE